MKGVDSRREGSRPRARLFVRTAAAVLLVGVAAGVTGGALTLLLHAVQHVAYGYRGGPFAIGAQQASGARRVLAMAGGGVVVGLGWWAVQRWSRGSTSVTAALADPEKRPPVPSAVADGALQIAAVGVGASLGREGAPRQVAAAIAGWLAGRLQLPLPRRRTLLACGAGAGLAAVYNVPFSGALFTLEVLLGSAAIGDVVPAVVTAVVATVVAWPVVGRLPTYTVPAMPVSWPLVVGSLLLGPVAGLVGWGFTALMGPARRRPVRGWRLPLTVTVGFAAVGGVAVWMPLVLGNGKGPAEFAFEGTLPVGELAVLLALKPLATAICLRAGAVGGLLTPAVATGAVLGGLAGEGWSHVWAGGSAGAYAVVGAAAVLATTQRAPLTAAVLAIEFTHSSPALFGPVLLAVSGAVLTGRLLQPPAGRTRRLGVIRRVRFWRSRSPAACRAPRSTHLYR